MTGKEIRKKFLEYFVKQRHREISSSSLIPEGDPSVLLTTAGMQQFKKYFMGSMEPPAPRLTSVQKCFRTSDIDEVGDERHDTFFEMLGNFAVGDYFKEDAIRFAWEVVTQVYQIPKERIFVTVFKGNDKVPRDTESVEIWQKVAGPDIEIQEFDMEDNFWPSPLWVGPCGPSSEIYVKYPNGYAIEIWNLVFTEFFHDAHGNLSPLKKKNIDTGMGLERIAMVIQDKDNIFETDLFSPIINAVTKVLKLDLLSEHDLKTARIIADHMRASTFLIADGVEPSNTERGYVLRRLIRRAMAQVLLRKQDVSVLTPIIGVVITEFGEAYPELKQRKGQINAIFETEVNKYKKAISQGLKIFEKEIAKRTQGDILPGSVAFLLHDTYGMPLDLTVQLGKDNNLDVDIAGFETALKEQQERSRSHRDESKETYDPALIAPVHTAAHLLNAALITVLGETVKQAGQKLTPGRVRHDITFDRALTKEEVTAVEKIINEKIEQNLPVKMVESTFEQAQAEGAQALFYETYQAKQSVTRYKIGEQRRVFSDELCGGPHVHFTHEVGRVTIEKEESAGAGKRRIYASVLQSS